MCIYVCMCVTVWTSICVEYMCVGRTAACIDMYKSRSPLRRNPKGYGVHREPQLPDCTRHGSPTPYAFSVPTRFSGACPNILGKQTSNPQVCSHKSGFGNHTTQRNTAQHNTTQHDTTRHGTARHDTTRHYTTQHNKSSTSWFSFLNILDVRVDPDLT